jgi:hypothetical protein
LGDCHALRKAICLILLNFIQQGNAGCLVIKQENRIVADLPGTAGFMGELVSPINAGIGALIDLLNDRSIKV